MQLSDLIKKLQGKPAQNEEVEFLVIQKKDDTIVCMDMSGITKELMQVLAKRGAKQNKDS